ncbi:MAG: antibiotic biosynthesis monooxygenase [Erysipelotrichaceae bacterium]|nr:antibiotic biosynthesis monooxygenase [Erysipelotrichaceae bacterium]
MIVLNVFYSGEYVKDYVMEMENSLVDKVKEEEGNITYDFYQSVSNPNEVLLVEIWSNQETMNQHQISDNMIKIKELKQKYQLNTRIEKYIKEERQ